MLADCHVHTDFSYDSETPMEAQVQRAIQIGMKRICFTDHMDMDFPDGAFWLDTVPYVECVQKLREKYHDQIEVRLGVELGLQPHLRERIRRYTEEYPFDFVIGSMHLLRGEDPYYGKIFEEIGDEAAYREYFMQTLENLKSIPTIHTLGHLDYIVRYGKQKETCYSYARYADEIDGILRYLIENGIALEVNTAGLRMLPFPNPHPDVVRRYRSLGGELVTVGSDAHTPEALGYRFSWLSKFLSECGFRYYTVFEKGKPVFIKF